MCEVLPPGQNGSVLIRHIVVTEEDCQLSVLRSLFSREDPVEPGVYVQLYVGGRLMMSDTQMEKSSNFEVVRRARGDVFIAGLGIGLILVPILANPEVASVTVVEKSAEVIKLVEPALRKLPGAEKLTILEADILEWKKLLSAAVQCITISYAYLYSVEVARTHTNLPIDNTLRR